MNIITELNKIKKYRKKIIASQYKFAANMFLDKIFSKLEKGREYYYEQNFLFIIINNDFKYSPDLYEILKTDFNNPDSLIKKKVEKYLKLKNMNVYTSFSAYEAK